MNEMTNYQGGGAVANPADMANAFASYGQQADRAGLPILKFKDGEYLVGGDQKEVKVGATLLAQINELQIGWIKMIDKTVKAERMGRLIDGFQPPSRDELGDTDESQWEKDPEGRPQDPWMFVNQFPVVFGSDQSPIDSDMALFSTASKGGIGAIGKLCKAYGEAIRQNPGVLPIIELGVDSYYNKAWDRKIKFPVLKPVDWMDADEAAKVIGNAAPAADDAANDPEPEPEPKKAAAGNGKRRF